MSQGTDRSMKKYVLVNWKLSCITKELIWRFKNIRSQTEECNYVNHLLMKWWWKFRDNSYHNIWKTLFINKYYSHIYIEYSPFFVEFMKLHTIPDNNLHRNFDHTYGFRIRFKKKKLWFQNSDPYHIRWDGYG